jgi:hypothetical protein
MPLAAAPFDRFRSPVVAPHRWQIAHFRLGTNEPTEIEATFNVGLDVGVAVQELREGALRTLEGWGKLSHRHVFVDSGAFSEGSFQGGQYVVSRPIGHEEWLRRLGLYDRIAQAFGERAWLVAPDRIGSQSRTFERQRLYQSEVLGILSRSGAQLIVPLQRGPWTMLACARRSFELYGRYRNVVWGIPLRKGATSMRDLGAFCQALALDRTLPHRFHLLGLAPPFSRQYLTKHPVASNPSPLYLDVRQTIATHLGDETPITSDSLRLGALVGGDRPITRYQREGLTRGEAIRRAYEAEMAAILEWERAG